MKVTTPGFIDCHVAVPGACVGHPAECACETCCNARSRAERNKLLDKAFQANIVSALMKARDEPWSAEAPWIMWFDDQCPGACPDNALHERIRYALIRCNLTTVQKRREGGHAG